MAEAEDSNNLKPREVTLKQIVLHHTLPGLAAVAIFGCVLYTADDVLYKRFGINFLHEPIRQSGYPNPDELEIKLKDSDGNGEMETVIEYGGKMYLLKLNEQDDPVLQIYNIESAREVPNR